MSENPFLQLDGVAQKWRALAERRRAHFVDLLESGRWKHYYSEDQFLRRMHEAMQVSDRWAGIAPPPAEATAVVQAEAGAAAAADQSAASDDEAAVPPAVTAQRSAA